MITESAFVQRFLQDERLTEREALIYYRREFLGMTLGSIAPAFNVCRARIQQIQAKTIRKLRHPQRTELAAWVKEQTPQETLNGKPII